MKKRIPFLSVCLLLALALPTGQACADIYKDIAALQKQTKKQRGDIKLLKLRLDKLERLIKNAADTPKQQKPKPKPPAPAPASKSGIITYP